MFQGFHNLRTDLATWPRMIARDFDPRLIQRRLTVVRDTKNAV